MSCFITSGEQLGCSDSIGGIKKVYIVGGGGEVTGYTYNAAGAITGATSTTGTTLYGFELKRGVSSLTQTLNKSYENGTVFFTQELTISLYKYDTAKRDKLKVLSQNDTLQIIAIDQNDVQYLLGQTNFSFLSAGDATSGQALGDKNGFSMTFQAQEAEPARVIVGALATVFGAPATVVG
jgi:uncharacterized protein (DUF1684 family)